MVQVFRCRICGDPYIGDKPPSQCPFCGAHQLHMLLASNPNFDWGNMFNVTLTDQDRRNLQATLRLEVDNATFYLCVSKTSKNEDTRAMFKALFKVEREHAEIAAKILRENMPKIELVSGICHDSDRKNMEDSLAREKRAVGFYSGFLKQTQDERLKEIFHSLIEIESDHIGLDEKKLEKLD